MISYSNKAITQLISAAISQRFVVECLRWPYQAKVMNRLEIQSRAAARRASGFVPGAVYPPIPMKPLSQPTDRLL